MVTQVNGIYLWVSIYICILVVHWCGLMSSSNILLPVQLAYCYSNFDISYADFMLNFNEC